MTDIQWLRELWDGPLVVKGILDPGDAMRAADIGIAGIVVSNHGGRQPDGVSSTIGVLPEIADAVLAGVSVDYYVRMEHGNLAGASDAVLDGVVRAPQLDEA